MAGGCELRAGVSRALSGLSRKARYALRGRSSHAHPPTWLTRVRAEAGDGADVTAYLPDAAEDGFVAFRPAATKTPALRAGTIDPNAPYTFSLPKNKRWKESRVANAISGSYCQVRKPFTAALLAHLATAAHLARYGGRLASLRNSGSACVAR